MALSNESGILIFSESYRNDEKIGDSLSDIQLSSSLFALYKLSCTHCALRWLRKVLNQWNEHSTATVIVDHYSDLCQHLQGDSLLLFRTTNPDPASQVETISSVGGLLVIIIFDTAFDNDEAARIADLITNVSRRNSCAACQLFNGCRWHSLPSLPFLIEL